MMTYINKFGIAMACCFATYASADHGVDAKSLVGKIYGGVHYSYFDADSDRLMIPSNANSYLDDGNGLGLDLGYRLSETNEIRLQYTDLTIDAKNSAFGDIDGSSIGIDYLYFPNKASLYMLAGVKEIDLEEDELSANLGLGYRHYFTEQFAGYMEGKGHYQFDNNHKDYSATLGLMYFFGAKSNHTKPIAAVKPTKKPKVNNKPKPDNKPKPVFLDTDRDGVYDRYDQCEHTPKGDKVDNRGCTVFTELTNTMTLLINFDNDKYNVKAEYIDQVVKAATFMKKYPHVKLTIQGHTSAQGAAEYNKRLSQKRANEVMHLLINKFNIAAERLEAVGYGEERLLNHANTSKAHQENRRIQAKISVVEKVAIKK